MALPVTPIAAYLVLLCWSSVPFAPTEPLLLAAGSFAGSAALALPIVIAAGAVGSLLSNLAKLAIGWYGGPAVLRWLARRPAGCRAVDWIEERLLRIGPSVLVPAHFIPFGAVAGCLLCGALRLPLRGVIVASAVAATAWSACFALIGYVGGATTGNPLLGLAIALAAALAIGILVKRRTTNRRPDPARRWRAVRDRPWATWLPKPASPDLAAGDRELRTHHDLRPARGCMNGRQRAICSGPRKSSWAG